MVKEISATDLETACRKCFRIEVSNIKALSCILDDMELEYTIISDSEADIFGSPYITNLTLALASKDCNVKSIYERDESLENYFISLVGGDNNA